MFLLSTIPSNSNLWPSELQNSLSNIEGTIDKLESLLSSTLLKKDYDYDPAKEGNQPFPDLDNSDPNAISQELFSTLLRESSILAQYRSMEDCPASICEEKA